MRRDAAAGGAPGPLTGPGNGHYRWIVKTPLIPCLALVLALAGPCPAEEKKDPAPAAAAPKEFVVRPIGQVREENGKKLIEIDKKYQDGLLGLEGFSHIHVIWWFDQNDTPEKRAVLQVHPRGNRDNPLTGVFATRSPFRPNLIALTLCKVVAVRGNVVEIDAIDAFPGTPVLDIKPFTPARDSAQDAKGPAWAK